MCKLKKKKKKLTEKELKMKKNYLLTHYVKDRKQLTDLLKVGEIRKWQKSLIAKKGGK